MNKTNTTKHGGGKHEREPHLEKEWNKEPYC